MRVHGGVEHDGATGRWRPVVHIWHDNAGRGDPDGAH
jgi:hypothetical protein